MISDLGMMAVHFFKGKQREIILKCLEHFSNDRPDHETERRIRELENSLEADVPYVKSCLIFGTSEGNLLHVFPGSLNVPGFHRGGRSTMELQNRRDYSKCSNFSLSRKENNTQGRDLTVDLTPLQRLHEDLKDPKYLTDFARELRKKPPVPCLNLIEKITHLDADKRVVEKVLHEGRVYIHLLLNGSQQEEIRVNVARLCKVQEEVTKYRPTQAVVKGICERFRGDLERIQSSHHHCNSKEFFEKLKELCDKLQEIKILPVSGNQGTSLPSTSQMANQQHETGV